MSTVQTLAAAPRKARETALPAPGAFLIPPATAPLPKDVRPDAPEGNAIFRELLTSLSRRPADKPHTTETRADRSRTRATTKPAADESNPPREVRENTPLEPPAKAETRDHETSSASLNSERTGRGDPIAPSDTPEQGTGGPPESDDAGRPAQASVGEEASETPPAADKPAPAAPSADSGADGAAEADGMPAPKPDHLGMLRHLAAQSNFSPATKTSTHATEAALSTGPSPVPAVVPGMRRETVPTADGPLADATNREAARPRSDTPPAPGLGESALGESSGGNEGADVRRPLVERAFSAAAREQRAVAPAPARIVAAEAFAAPSVAQEVARLLAAAGGVAGSGPAGSKAGASAREPAGVRTLDAAPGQSVATASTTAADGSRGTFRSVLVQQSSPVEAGRGVERTAELIRANIGERNSTIVMRLEPPELGEMKLNARLHDGTLSLKIEAASTAAKEVLEARVQELRQALERHGIRIDRVDIDVRPASPGAHGGNTEPRGQNEGSSQQPSTQGGMLEQGQHRGTSSGHAGHGDAPPEARMETPDAAESRAGVTVEGPPEADRATESRVNVLA